ncbi:MAG: N-acetyltransferase, partial [Pseudomonas sp.]
MSVIEKLQERIRQKGLGRTFSTLWKRYVFFHWELLWMERDLVSPVPPHKLRPYEGLRKVDITPQNAGAFAKHFGDRVKTMAELAAEGHTGHMYLDADGHAVGFIWGSIRD